MLYMQLLSIIQTHCLLYHAKQDLNANSTESETDKLMFLLFCLEYICLPFILLVIVVVWHMLVPFERKGCTEIAF